MFESCEWVIIFTCLPLACSQWWSWKFPMMSLPLGRVVFRCQAYGLIPTYLERLPKTQRKKDWLKPRNIWSMESFFSNLSKRSQVVPSSQWPGGELAAFFTKGLQGFCGSTGFCGRKVGRRSSLSLDTTLRILRPATPSSLTSSHRSVRIPLPPCMSSLNGARAATMPNAAGPFLGASYPCSHLCDIYVQHCLGWAVSTPKNCWYKLLHRVTLNLWISTKHVKLYSTITLLARCRFYWHVFLGVVSLFGAPFGSTKGYIQKMN